MPVEELWQLWSGLGSLPIHWTVWPWQGPAAAKRQGKPKQKGHRAKKKRVEVFSILNAYEWLNHNGFHTVHFQTSHGDMDFENSQNVTFYPLKLASMYRVMHKKAFVRKLWAFSQVSHGWLYICQRQFWKPTKLHLKLWTSSGSQKNVQICTYGYRFIYT